MPKTVKLIIILLFIGIIIYWIVDYLALFKTNQTSSITLKQESKESVEYEVVEVARELFVPWSIAFTNDMRALITERAGTVKVMENDKVLPGTLVEFDVSTKSEEGLMGLAVDPNYDENKYIYVCYAYENGSTLVDKVVRLIDNGNSAKEDKILVDNIPAAQYHAGCRLKFAPDEKLYITTGDATNRQIAQNLNSLGGKILRINSDGTIPEDNPYENSMVYSYGHRNPQGITWDPITGVMVSTEHGPSISDGPAGGDEVNVIEKGENYGWPLVSHEKSIPEAKDPIIVYTPAVAPASALIYSGKLFPQFKQNLFFGGLRGEGLFRVIFTDNTFEEVKRWEKLGDVDFGRIREVVEAPNGEIYFTTSNRDGRGNVRNGDDKIYKLTPVL